MADGPWAAIGGGRGAGVGCACVRGHAIHRWRMLAREVLALLSFFGQTCCRLQARRAGGAPAHCARKAPCYQPCGHCGGAANHPVQGETACAFTWAWVRQLRRRQARKAVAAWTAMNKCAACALAESMKGGFDGECAATRLCHRLGYGSKKLCHCAGPGERLHMAPLTRSLTRSLGAVRRG